MGTVKKEVLIGVLVAVFATCAGMFIYLEYVSRFGFYETIEMIQKGGVFGPVIALASIPNLFVFMIFIKKKQDFRARGVLLTTIVTALLTLILKLI